MKYAPGLMVGQLSGSTGSTTAGRNRYGSYFRSRTIPVNPNSVSQQLARADFGALTQAWRTITESQRESWANLAPNVARTDSLGVSYVLSGNAMFISLNRNRLTVGFSILDDAPALDSPPVILTLSVGSLAGGAGTMTLAYTASGGASTNRWIIRATAPRSPGRDYIGRSEFRDLASVGGDLASPISAASTYNAVFGSGWQAQVGMRIDFEMVPISEEGFAGVPVRTAGIIAA